MSISSANIVRNNEGEFYRISISWNSLCFKRNLAISPGWVERNAVLLEHPVFSQYTRRREQVVGGWTERNCTLEAFEWFLMQYITNAWGAPPHPPPLYICFPAPFSAIRSWQMFARSALKSSKFPAESRWAERPLFFPGRAIKFSEFSAVKKWLRNAIQEKWRFTKQLPPSLLFLCSQKGGGGVI